MALNLNLPKFSVSTVNSVKKNKEVERAHQVYLNPSVPFSVIDHYLRRNDKQDRVIGTLLGTRSEEGKVVEIKSCFPVPHFETDSHVEVDMEYHRIFYNTLKKVNPNEEIVGWYATGSKIGKHAPLIQEFYALEALPHDSVHMIMDTGLEGESLNIQMFSGIYFGAVGQPDGVFFSPLKYEFSYPKAERKVLELVAMSKGDVSTSPKDESGFPNGNGSVVPLITDMEQLEQAIQDLLEMVRRVNGYVKRVIDGTSTPDIVVGKYLMEMLSCVPRIDPENFEALFQGHLQNLLMVVYLSNLVRAQVNISNRLLWVV
ncbi:Eukaryotic translation initiation factor 3 subunit F [Zancudomyces culisetae]|uniref:Eukaryotic translation initiation factor 3 subunit F n=1 Tax=Zancudomyces culisetae TaxID=1213189 RepID=A0A1R1PS01_ZANCU|nr:Eukaryotic translation initiation factor 3 subunit F [Zancudomyces culisetae]|eukprot:OMH83709.1 Eukaryotic translation initiation factor 3 subunit F [Zancudomyces culisetae]